MPRAKDDKYKSPEELDEEIKELRKKLTEKTKAKREADKRKKAKADQARAAAEIQFNKDFVEKAKEISWSDYEDDGRTVYEVIEDLIRPAVPQAPEAEADREPDAAAAMGGQVPEPQEQEPVVDWAREASARSDDMDAMFMGPEDAAQA